MTGPGRVGVVVLDHGRPADAERAAASARESTLDVRVLVVENGTHSLASFGGERLRLDRNHGFGGGMNAGIERLRADGCELFLLLNNDAVLEPGCLRVLAEAAGGPAIAGVGPVVLTDTGTTIESCGVRVDLRWGRVRLLGHGARPGEAEDLRRVDAISGVVLMLSLAAIERVGLLDEAYFFGFEDLDWCVRARRAGFDLVVATRARARHAGSQTLGRGAPDRLYYATRNHLRFVEKQLPLAGAAGTLRRELVLGLNLAFALRQRDVKRVAAVRAVIAGYRDARRRRVGPRPIG